MKVALYIRVSTEEQAQEGYSINGQINTLTDYCKRNNFEIVEIYKDEGISGKSIERPQLKKLLLDCKSGCFDMVMVWKISRLSRRQVDFLNVIEYLGKNNVSFFSYSENIDASTPTGKAMLQMMGSFAELERNITVENLKMGMKQRSKEGKWNGGSMLGYTSKNKSLVIVEKESKLVRYIFNLYINGQGYKAIANKLNHEGYKTKKNSNFSTNSIRTIVTNPAYAGFIRFNQFEDWNEKRRKGKNDNYVIVKGEHEAIIDIKTWEKAQKIFKQRSKKPPKTFNGHFPLTTLLRCPQCGQGMIGHKIKKSKSSNEYLRYYQCGNFHYKGSAVCKSNLLRADEVEQYVFNKLEKIVCNPSLIQPILEKVNEKIRLIKMPIEDKLAYIADQLHNIDKSINKYLSIMEKSEKIPDSIITRIDVLDKEKIELLSQKDTLTNELNKPIIKEISFEKIHNSLKNFSQLILEVSPEQQKDLLHSIISKITVNLGKSPSERSVKEIELFFDASKNSNYVLTYGKVHFE